MSASRRLDLRLLIIGMMLAAGFSRSAGAVATDEALVAAVKIAYLSKFALYVDWPAPAFPSPTSNFVLCVVGSDQIAEALEKTERDQRIGDRPVVVRHVKSVGRDSGCHILFIAEPDGKLSTPMLDAVRGEAVLTVTDAPPGNPAIGIVNFQIQDDRVRFSIDEQAATQNRLSISSKLLSLALSVTPKK